MATHSFMKFTLLFSISLLLCFNLSSAAFSTTELITQMLEGHNKAREAVGVPPLKWDPLLARYARIYSNQRRRDCKLVHSPGYAFGECLFRGQGRRWSAKDAVAAWVDEKKWYNYDTNTCSGKKCSHYTQIVWRATQRVGCAKIICNSGDSYITCEYHPPGNYIGVKPY